MSSFLFEERFTGSDGTEIDSRNSDSGHGWTETTGIYTGANGGKITSNRLRCTDALGSLYYSAWVPPNADYAIQADFIYNGATTGTPLVEVHGRKTADSVFTSYRMRMYHDGTNLVFALQGVSSGAQVDFSSASVGTLTAGAIFATIAGTPTSGTRYVMELVMVGNNISVLRNGAVVMAGVGTGPTAAGRVGVACFGQTGSTMSEIDHMSSGEIDYRPTNISTAVRRASLR